MLKEFALTNRYAREAAIVLLGYLVYLSLRVTLLDNVAPTSFINAERVVEFERRFNIFQEPAIQAWLLDNAHAFLVAANWFYSIGFFPMLIGISLFWLRFNPTLYVQFRRVFLITLVMTWLIYIMFPLAPPRLIPGEGFVDTIAAFGPNFYTSKESMDLYNPYSAMPSMHFGWILLVAIWMHRSSGRNMAIVGYAYAFLTLVAIVVTANHYFIDAVVGAMVVSLAFGIQKLGAALLRRNRTDTHSFTTA